MAEAFIVRRGGGGGSGGTLVVTSSGAGTVTVSNTALGKSYSKTVAAGGSVTFKGLKTGEWTATLSNGAQTATRSVTINADYSVSVAYFSATISVTYPATSTCVITNSDGQTVASDTNNSSSTKTWTATVGATGTYTVTATATDGSGKTKSTTVSITADGQSKSVKLSYELILFDNGNYDKETGGFTGISGNYLYSYSKRKEGGVQEFGNWSTNNAINLAGYATLHFIVAGGTYGVGDSEAYNAACVQVGLSTGRGSTGFVASKNVSNGAFTEYTLSLSGNQSSYYIVGHTDGGDWTSVAKTTTCHISKLWLT